MCDAHVFKHNLREIELGAQLSNIAFDINRFDEIERVGIERLFALLPMQPHPRVTRNLNLFRQRQAVINRLQRITPKLIARHQHIASVAIAVQDTNVEDTNLVYFALRKVLDPEILNHFACDKFLKRTDFLVRWVIHGLHVRRSGRTRRRNRCRRCRRQRRRRRSRSSVVVVMFMMVMMMLLIVMESGISNLDPNGRRNPMEVFAVINERGSNLTQMSLRGFDAGMNGLLRIGTSARIIQTTSFFIRWLKACYLVVVLIAHKIGAALAVIRQMRTHIIKQAVDACLNELFVAVTA
mmetsp:Transcript_25287/g.41167  ORF Transcript_25287/g.41167 Transcript_25287/m.41167 type:complete len:295 (-) Transcript_25287:713-1597(-)